MERYYNRRTSTRYSNAENSTVFYVSGCVRILIHFHPESESRFVSTSQLVITTQQYGISNVTGFAKTEIYADKDAA